MIEEEGITMILDINEIQKILPHRPPMLLVDRIIELEPFKSGWESKMSR